MFNFVGARVISPDSAGGSRWSQGKPPSKTTIAVLRLAEQQIAPPTTPMNKQPEANYGVRQPSPNNPTPSHNGNIRLYDWLIGYHVVSPLATAVSVIAHTATVNTMLQL